MRARKRFGQHFLERAWADRLLVASGIGAGDHVVEIGPGRGVLTGWLSERNSARSRSKSSLVKARCDLSCPRALT